MKQLAIATLIASAGLVGCNTYDTANHGKAVSLEPSHNFLGIVRTEPGSYSANNNATVRMSTNEFYSRRTSSGDRVVLLWGAITITDY